jgi:hypothetical protein
MSLDISTLYLVATIRCGHAGRHAAVFRQAGEYPGAEMVSTAYLLGAASVALWTPPPALGQCFAGAQRRRLRGLRHGLNASSTAASRLAGLVLGAIV